MWPATHLLREGHPQISSKVSASLIHKVRQLLQFCRRLFSNYGTSKESKASDSCLSIHLSTKTFYRGLVLWSRTRKSQTYQMCSASECFNVSECSVYVAMLSSGSLLQSNFSQLTWALCHANAMLVVTRRLFLQEKLYCLCGTAEVIVDQPFVRLHCLYFQ